MQTSAIEQVFINGFIWPVVMVVSRANYYTLLYYITLHVYERDWIRFLYGLMMAEALMRALIQFLSLESSACNQMLDFQQGGLVAKLGSDTP